LKMNDKKTKGMVIDGAKPPTMMSHEAFDQKRGVGQRRTHWEKVKARMQCHLCGVMAQNQVLVRHQLAGACKRGRDNGQQTQKIRAKISRHQTKPPS
jgi:hypothetical protein